MNLFFDTSVLVAASASGHPHAQAFAALKRAKTKGNRGWMSQHSVAQVDAVLPRIHPIEALRILEENLFPLLRIVSLDSQDYRDVVRELAVAGWRSGKVYDALHIRCAGKQPIDRLLTFNVQEFLALAPASLRKKVCAP